MRRRLNRLIYWLDCLIPKNVNQFAFASFPDLSDNSYAMFKYILKHKPNVKIVWLIANPIDTNKFVKQIQNDMGLNPEDIRRITFIQKNSLLGVFNYLRSKYVFFTHGLYPQVKFSNNHILINLWHGMPLKKIGLLLDADNPNMPKANFIVSTSPFFQEIMMKVFAQTNDEVLVCGQPRNDLLFENLGALNKFKIDKSQYKKIFLWTPTFRQANVGTSTSDGSIFSGLPVIGDNYTDFNASLLSMNSYMIIKLHPMDVLNDSKFNDYSNLLFLRNADLEEQFCQLYSLLGEIDVLITDFSSIYIDFLLLNKPIGFVMDDLERYKSSRGFVIDNPEQYMPGEFISTETLFIDFLNKCVDDVDTYENQRVEVNNIFNTYKTNFSKLIWNQILERTK